MTQVYFIECGERIKVGFSKNVEARIRTIETINALPVKLVCSIVGSKRLEKAIHQYLAPHHAQGEWFFDCPQVRSVISELSLIGGQAIGFRHDAPAPVERRKSSPAIGKQKHPKYSALLKQLAEPLQFGDRTKYAIDRAARRAGLSYWRAFDIWYGKARRIETHEAESIETALAA
jgi:hypothetical protein